MITRFKQSAIAVVLVVAGIGAAQAEGLYAGGSLGSPDYRNSVNGISGDGSGVGGKVSGGYTLTPNVSVEASLFDLGHVDDATGSIKLRGGSLDAVGTYEFAPQWSVLGRAGLVEGRFTTSRGDDSSPGLKLGAGLQYDLTRQVGLRAEYEHYRFSDAFDDKPRVDEFSLGLKVGF